MKMNNLIKDYKRFLRIKIDKKQLNKLGIEILADGYLDEFYLVIYRQDDRLWLINQVFKKGDSIDE